jgi:hypothetical protein
MYKVTSLNPYNRQLSSGIWGKFLNLFTKQAGEVPRAKARSLSNMYNSFYGATKKGRSKSFGVSFGTLRRIASVDTVIRICINVIKKEVSQSKWSIKRRDEIEKIDEGQKKEALELFKFINGEGENLRMLLDRVIEDILVLDAGCLWGQELIELPDGSKITIAEVVNKKLDIDVLSFNESIKKFEPKKVTGWHKNKLNDREWVKVNYTYSRNMGRHGRKACWFTDDHKLLTNNGWKEIKNIESTDLVLTKEIEPNELQKQVIRGSLLGDACLEGRKNSFRRCLGLCHSVKQEEWLDRKVTSLNGLEFSTKYYRDNTTFNSKLVRQRSNYIGWFEKETEKWLNNNVKIVPNDIELTPLLLATWYMDDGHKSQSGCYFNTCGFDINSQRILVKKVNEYGIENNLQKSGKYYRIYVTAEGTKKLHKIISKYIIPELRYKLHLEDTFEEYNKKEWDLGESLNFYDSIEVTKGNPTGGNSVIPKTTYCIDVEDNHNFIASGMVAHNCLELIPNSLGEVVALNSVDALTINPNMNERGEFGNIAYYQVIDEKVVASFSKDEIIYMMANPQNDVNKFGFGLSNIESILLTVQSSLNADVYNAMMFNEDNVPPGILHLGNVMEDEAESIKELWNAETIGKTQQMRFTFGPEKIQYFPFKNSNKEMQYIELVNWLTRLKLAVYGLSPMDANITQDVNKSTAQIQKSISNSRGVRNMKHLIEESFLKGIFDKRGWDTIKLEFDKTSDINDQLIQAKVDEIYTVKTGIKTENEIRDRMGLSDLDIQPIMNEMVLSPEEKKQIGESQKDYLENVKYPTLY